ncbi:hypothetical protein B0H15DRAFT_955578 [Mycena belliarum]|uniref:SH3 domain-binding glutamic acid-rich protein n=1 Tax=Mycena belliarum TaxID=1033014 RepID=A0AAD6TW91_9AGAR|nr:hypothetical protein B0H15DRAFT_955578 [Mycena belliae]
MPSPPIELFLTTIASQPALRQRQEYVLRILQVKKIPFTSYDLASDEKAKRLWKRKGPAENPQLPGILVGGKFPGPFSEFEDAVECGELDTFLRLKESWDADIDADTPALPVVPVGVPGAMMPLQMTPEHLRTKIMAQQSSPLKGKDTVPVNKRDDTFDVSTELSGFGLQGVQVSHDELAQLVAELGLDGDDAGDLVKGLSSAPPPKKAPEPTPPTIKPLAKEVKPLEPAAEVQPVELTPEVKHTDPAADVKPIEDSPEVIEGSKAQDEIKQEAEREALAPTKPASAQEEAIKE